jgi:hypothetical protein
MVLTQIQSKQLDCIEKGEYLYGSILIVRIILKSLYY